MIDFNPSNQWLVNINPGRDAKLRMFCFHYAGGNANVFRQWQHVLPQDIDLLSVELPGHGSRLGEPLIDRMDALVEKVATGLSRELTPPFVFFGHSMGALVGFELIRFLRRHFLPQPAHFFVSAHVAPHLSHERKVIHNLPDSEFVGKLREFNGTPEEILNNPELCDLFVPIIRNDFKVCETYDYRSGLQLNCDITAYGGKEDKDIDPTSLEAWKEHTTGNATVRLLDGDHFFIHHKQNEFLRQLSNDLLPLLN